MPPPSRERSRFIYWLGPTEFCWTMLFVFTLMSGEQIYPMEPALSKTGYYVVQNDQKQGPFDLSTLRGMRQQGTLMEETLIWIDGMPNWEAAKKVVPEVFIHAVTAGDVQASTVIQSQSVTQSHPQALAIAEPQWR